MLPACAGAYAEAADACDAADAAPALSVPWLECGADRNNAHAPRERARERRRGAEYDMGLAARRACGKGGSR